jgi:hypothetical protein
MLCLEFGVVFFKMIGATIAFTCKLSQANNCMASPKNITTLLLGGAADGVCIDNWMWERQRAYDSRTLWTAQPIAMAVARLLESVVGKRYSLL